MPIIRVHYFVVLSYMRLLEEFSLLNEILNKEKHIKKSTQALSGNYSALAAQTLIMPPFLRKPKTFALQFTQCIRPGRRKVLKVGGSEKRMQEPRVGQAYRICKFNKSRESGRFISLLNC